MEKNNIHAHNIELSETMQKNILKRLHSVFGYEQYEVQKIDISFINEIGTMRKRDKSYQIQIKVNNIPTIKTELKSLDILTAVTIAIERAHLKLSHSLKAKMSNGKFLSHNKIIESYDVYGN